MPRGVKGSRKSKPGSIANPKLSGSAADQEKLKVLQNKEKDARNQYYYWTNRAHPNSNKMLGLKAAHHSAMVELISYQEELGMRSKIQPLAEVPIPTDLQAEPEGVVAYDPGHKVTSTRSWKDNQDKPTYQQHLEPLGVETLVDLGASPKA